MVTSEFLWLFISDIASPTMLGLLLLIYVLFLFSKQKYSTGFFILLTSLSAVTIIYILKNIVQRERPEQAFYYLSDFSFPSGHATFATIFFMISIYLAYKHHHKVTYIVTVIISIIMMIMVGLSRIFLSVHWATDVLAGYIIGLIVFYLCLNFFDKDTARHLFGLHKAKKRKYTRRNIRKPPVRKRKVVTS